MDRLPGRERQHNRIQRKAKNADDYLIFALNFTPVPRLGSAGVPERVFYKEVLNSDA